MDVVSIAKTSKSRQFHRRRKKASSLKKKKQDIGRTPVDSMNLSPKGGPKVRDEVVSMNPQKRHLQTTKGTGVAVHQGAHLTVDSHDSLVEPGEDVTEESKEQHGRGKVRSRKEDQVQVRRHKVPPHERTEIQCTKPGNLKGKKTQQEAVGRQTTFKRFVLMTHCNASGASRV